MQIYKDISAQTCFLLFHAKIIFKCLVARLICQTTKTDMDYILKCIFFCV